MSRLFHILFFLLDLGGGAVGGNIGMTTLFFFFAGRLKSTQLADIIGTMVRMNLAVYEPPKQMRAVLLYWRLPEEWAEVLHEWVRANHPSNPISFFSHT